MTEIDCLVIHRSASSEHSPLQGKQEWLCYRREFVRARLSERDARVMLVEEGPEWRNWQTRWTQNPVVLSTVWVRPPPPGPNFFSKQARRKFRPNTKNDCGSGRALGPSG